MPSFTKKAIIESFVKMLNEKPLDKITIKDIVEDCGINRNTFYYHFEDIPSLIDEILRAETERVISEHGSFYAWEDAFIAAARFALENKRAAYHLYNSISRETIERYFNRIAKDVMSRFVESLSADIPAKDDDKELIADFYKAALVGMVLDWMNAGMKRDPEQLIIRLGALFEGNIREALERSAYSPS